MTHLAKITTVFASLAGFAVLSGTAAAETVDCPMERAVYTIPGHDGHELRFPLAAEPSAFSALEARLTSHQTGNVYVFDYTVSMGYSGAYLVPRVQPPLIGEDAAGRSLGLYLFEHDLAPSSLAGEGEMAPPYVFVPELGRFLWYDLVVEGDREALPTAIWHLSGCA